MASIYDNAYYHETFNFMLDTLLDNYIRKQLNIPFSKNIDFSLLRKAGWIASILAGSNEEIHKQKAQTFAVLLFLYNTSDINFSKLSYVLFSRTGNLLATKFLSQLFNIVPNLPNQVSFKEEFGTLLDFEVGLKLYENTIELNDDFVITTDFQKKLWTALNIYQNVSISAPTSSGKSFIIQRFIKYQFENAENFSVLYIVPSKALLNQVSEQFRAVLNKSIQIKTAFIGENTDNISEFVRQKQMYVLTPERCLNALNQTSTVEFSPNLIFIDEIQNVEDEEGRGVLMEYVLGELSKKWANAKIIIAGPSISESDELFKELFNQESENVETLLSPVIQIKALVIPDKQSNQLKLKVKSFSDTKDITIPIEVDFDVKSIFESSQGSIVSRVISNISRGEQSIIYAPRTDFAEKWALESLSFFPSVDLRSISELIDFLKEEIHPRYYLIDCLRKGVAFHHSKLPELVRKEIEYLFDKGQINYLFCTSTLLQGVNLPAKNLFLISARKRSDSLSPFEFGNLIGRAGRIKDSLYGQIFFITKQSVDEIIAQKYFSENYQKEVILASTKSFLKKDFIDKDLKNTELDSNKNKNGYTITHLRQKYLAGKDELRDYLIRKQINNTQIEQVVTQLGEQLSDIKVPYEIIKLNPSVDPLLQNKLYLRIKEEGYQNWAITPNPNFNRRIKKNKIVEHPFQDLSFFWQFSIICQKLDEVFEIGRETYFKHNISNLSIGSISYFGFRWLQNTGFREIIEDDINFYGNIRKKINPDNVEDINNRIKEVMNIHSKVITFTLVKYFKVLTDILELFFSEDDREKYKLTLSLPVMLELGTMDPIMIRMISSGINRSVALQIYHEFIKVNNYLEIDVINWLYENGENIKIKPIYTKYLKDLGFIQ
ncbi:DEAD/DEAH box helicase [Paenibacillus faecis]|uniref:DEAD/DEAH box helicase n=1 Tax=Paenibacillus faecis TaxID=862114 RepID=A0A5D0CU44_9BACL|nr:DEAD/DEAH box helicase [Paenibacillus faecis]TYA13501.1 DEAD/DEAH box helicase [Paenibacillus faecis]